MFSVAQNEPFISTVGVVSLPQSAMLCHHVSTVAQSGCTLFVAELDQNFLIGLSVLTKFPTSATQWCDVELTFCVSVQPDMYSCSDN